MNPARREQMKKLLMVIPLVILICFTFSCQQGEEVAEEPVVDVEADVEAIKARYDQKTAALKAGDLVRWINLFSEDVIFMPPNAPILDGREAVQQWGQPFFEQFNMDEAISFDEIEVSDNWAFGRTTYTFKAMPKAGGEEIVENGKYIHIFKKLADGTWICTHCMWSSNDPLPTPKKE
jgi:uncharacterized protein (TIGR02246 family)